MKQHVTALLGVIILVGGYGIARATPADDLIKMARSGVDEEVLISYIESSTDTYDLDAEEIITLKDLGVSSKVISEALRHGNKTDSAEARESIKEANNDTDTASAVLSTAAAVVGQSGKYPEAYSRPGAG